MRLRAEPATVHHPNHRIAVNPSILAIDFLIVEALLIIKEGLIGSTFELVHLNLAAAHYSPDVSDL